MTPKISLFLSADHPLLKNCRINADTRWDCLQDTRSRAHYFQILNLSVETHESNSNHVSHRQVVKQPHNPQDATQHNIKPTSMERTCMLTWTCQSAGLLKSPTWSSRSKEVPTTGRLWERPVCTTRIPLPSGYISTTWRPISTRVGWVKSHGTLSGWLWDSPAKIGRYRDELHLLGIWKFW